MERLLPNRVRWFGPPGKSFRRSVPRSRKTYNEPDPVLPVKALPGPNRQGMLRGAGVKAAGNADCWAAAKKIRLRMKNHKARNDCI
jgi:hypothetical protein